MPPATAKTIRYRSNPSAFRVRRELGAQRGHGVAHGLELAVIVAPAQGAADEGGDLRHLLLSHARRRLGGRSDAQPAGLERRAGVVGHRVLVESDARSVEYEPGLLAG